MRRHQPFQAAPAVHVGLRWTPGQHDFEHAEQVIRDFVIGAIAGVVEGD